MPGERSHLRNLAATLSIVATAFTAGFAAWAIRCYEAWAERAITAFGPSEPQLQAFSAGRSGSALIAAGLLVAALVSIYGAIAAWRASMRQTRAEREAYQGLED